MSRQEPIYRPHGGMSPVEPLALGGIPGDVYHGSAEQDPETKAKLDALAAFIAQNSVSRTNITRKD